MATVNTQAKPVTETTKAGAGKPREGTHKAQVVAMLQRKGRATLEEIFCDTLIQASRVPWIHSPSNSGV
jgi:hypothetical protein